MLDRYPTSLQSAYLDLVSRHLNRRINEIGGRPVLRKLKGRCYWYAEVAIQGRKVFRYLGPDTPEMQERIEAAKEAVEDERRARDTDRSIVRQLVAAGAPRLDPNTGSLLRAMTRCGVFRLGGTLVGTHAYRLYALELGVKLRGLYEATQDVDVASFERLSLALGETVDPSLADALGGLGMEPAPSLDHKRPTRWISRAGGPEVDFLAPAFEERQGPIRLAAFDGWAQGLHYLNYLIAKPIHAVALYLDGIFVQVPRPERYAIHKLIVAQRRRGGVRSKARKDLDQAADLVEVLAVDRRHDLDDAFEAAMNAGPKWRDAITSSLKQRPDINEILQG